jgi:predicted transcriptional regulator
MNPATSHSSADEQLAISAELRQRLAALASNTRRPDAELANEALTQYLDYQEWAIKEVERGVAAANRREVVPDAVVQEWIGSLGTDSERPVPQSRTV